MKSLLCIASLLLAAVHLARAADDYKVPIRFLRRACRWGASRGRCCSITRSSPTRCATIGASSVGATSL